MPAAATIDDLNYLRFRDLVFERIGAFYDTSKRDVLASALWESVVNQHAENPGDFYQTLQSSPTSSPVWSHLVSLLTIGETYFFRNPNQFDLLRLQILPPLIARRQDSRHLRIWSAGCASGEEPYSVAILLRQLIPDIQRWNITILGTDIDAQRLDQAKRATYREWSFRQVSPQIRDTYFHQDGLEYHLLSQVKEMVVFEYLNLVEDQYPSLQNNTLNIDLILWRNVAIYLPSEVTRRVAEKMYACLVVGGWLMVGAHEMNDALFKQYTVHNFNRETIYQKPTLQAKQDKRPAAVAVKKSTILARKPTIPVIQAVPVLKAEKPDHNLAKEVSALDLLRHGQALIKQGRQDEARVKLSAALALDGELAEGYYYTARIDANQGKLEQALQNCQKAIDHAPFLVEAHCTLGTIYQELGQSEKAIEYFKKALYLSADNILAHVNLAVLYRNNGRTGDADRHQANAIRLTSRLAPDEILPGSDDLTSSQLLSMLRAVP